MAAGLFLSSLILGALGVFAFPSAVSDFLADVTGIRQSTIKALLDPVSGKIPLSLLPTGHGGGFDADQLDGRHASAFAAAADLEATRADLDSRIAGLNLASQVDLSPYLKKIGTATDSSRLGGSLPSFYQDAGHLSSGTLPDLRLSGNVALIDLAQTFTATKTFSGGLTVSGGALTLPAAAVADSALSANVALLAGSQTFTGTKSFAALLSAGSGFTLSSGALSLPGSSILDSALSANVALLSSAQTISGAKTFSAAITAPTAGNSINGLIVNSGALSGVTTLTASGALTAATAGNTLNGVIFSSGNATLANLTSSTGSLTSTVADSGTAVGFVLGTQASYVTAGAKLLQLKNNATVALTVDKDGNLTAGGNIVATGTIQGTQLISTVATGTAPLSVSSTTQVTNLNANFLQGYQASDLYSVPQPNLVPNSDFSRRTKWMTFMPETFADTSGWTLEAGTSIGTVSANKLTPGGTTSWKISAGVPTWRDIRASLQLQLKAASTQGVLIRFVDTSNYIRVIAFNSNFYADKVVAGVVTNLWTVAVAPTGNNYYWLEAEMQGSTLIGKWYSSGVSPVAKSSASLVNTQTATVSDSALVAGKVGIMDDTPANGATYGGLATGDGGVYVEGWGPESWTPSFTFNGGQAIGFDESADSGPLGKQWTMRAYIPATSRIIYLDWNNGPPFSDGWISPSTAYVSSMYEKVSGLGGSGVMTRVYFQERDSAGGSSVNHIIVDGAEAAWTRKTVAFTTGASAVKPHVQFEINGNMTRTGTAFFMLPQWEQGSVATPWRPLPDDFGPLMITAERNYQNAPGAPNTTSVSLVEMDARSLAANVFLPWDATVDLHIIGSFYDGGAVAGSPEYLDFNVDGARAGTNSGTFWWTPGANYRVAIDHSYPVKLPAGKHRIAAVWATGATGSLSAQNDGADGRSIQLRITAMKGR